MSKIKLFFIILLILLVIYYISYYIYINRNLSKINDLLKDRTIIPIESKSNLLDKPLNEFFINSSHNTYLNSFQHLSIVRSNYIKNVLKLGARVIELDISHIKNKPIIAHGTKDFITTTYISLENALDTIYKYGFNTSDPLIIFCEIFNPENEILNTNIKKIFLDKFKHKLLLPNTLEDKFISYQPIRLFLNKVILFGTIDKNKVLEEIFLPGYNFVNYPDADPKTLEFYKDVELTKIYPTEGIKSYLSFNIDFLPLWKKNYKLIGMNYQMKDELLYNYLKYFKNTSFIHQSEIIL